MNRQNILKTAIMLAATLLIAACTNDEMADSQPETLPEGQYPLEIASVTMSANAPQSRVVENSNDGMSSAWEWDNTEKIGVRLYEDGETATYTLNENLSLTSDKTLYWKNTEGATITAWYPTYEGESGTVSLANQSKKLAYVLAGAGNGSYQQPAKLTFTHALAKVRVVLQGDQAEQVENIQIKSFTSCTQTQGKVSTKDAQDGWITMMSATYNDKKCWEANVVPDYKITAFQVNGAEGTLKNDGITPLAAKVNTITLIVSKLILQPDSEGNYTVNEGDNVIIKGNSSQTPTTGQIIINGDATVTIQDVNIKTSKKPAIKITNGTATIKLEGNNILESSNSQSQCAAGIELSGTNSHVIIEGNENVSLTVTADCGNPAIGSGNGGKGGNITIRNATITASATNTQNCGCGAAIGSGSSWVSGEARIGVITIINSDITASVGNNMGSAAAVIGTGDTTYDNEKNSCGDINITLKAGQTKSQFLKKLTGGCSVQVGAGSNSLGGTNTCGSINWYNSDGTSAN